MAHDLMAHEVTRREFLAGAGALVVSFSLAGSLLSQGAAPAPAAPGAAPTLPPDLAATPTLDSWLKIDSAGNVTVYSGKVDLGQGIGIAFEQIVADELDVSLAQITNLVQGDTALTPNEGYTAGSLSIAQGGMALRYAAATARQYLVGLAAKKFGLDPGQLTVADGVVRAPDGRSVTYGQLIGGHRFDLTVTSPPPLKDPSQYRYVGKPEPRLEIPGIMTAGSPVYIQNLRLPGMLHGRVLRPPSPGAQLLSLDTSRAEKMPGVVKVVRDGSFVGVVAENEWAAIQAVEALRSAAVWGQTNRFVPADEIDTYLRTTAHSDIRELDTGTALPALAKAAVRVKADYSVPYIAHASIGPSCAIAQLHNGNQWTIWSHTQGVYPDQQALSYLLGVPASNIRVIHMEGAGCYGHNGADDVNADAALLAAAVPGRPVRVQWMRADEFQWEPYGSAMSFRLEGGLDASGNLVAWNHDVWTATYSTRPGPPGWLLAGWYLAQPQLPGPAANVGGDRNAVPYYNLANARVYCHYIERSPLRVSAHRTLGAFRNIFAIESFMDELAAAAKADPVAFRLKYLNDPRATAVIQAVTKAAGWRPGPRPSGRGQGFAFTRYENAGAYVATVAEVEVDRATGQVAVRHIYTSVDVGQIVNPNGLANQAEGGAIQATSWTLKEQVTWGAQAIESVDWVTYPILTFPEVPEVTVLPIDNPTLPPVGFGEAACVPIGAAIANAVFDATGARLRRLPLTPERVRAALSQV
jgi:nicotinate dehydrogenase subunit B